MSKLLYLITFTIVCSAAFAQQPAKEKRHNVFFLKNNGRFVEQRDSADYICIISEPDSGSTLFIADEFYKDGKRKFIGSSSKSEYLSPEGKCITYFHNGNKKAYETYEKGKRSGLCYYFYPNGRLYVAKEFHTKEATGNSVSDESMDYLIKDCKDSTGKVLVQDGKGYFVGYDDDFKYIGEEGSVVNGMPDSVWTGRDVSAKIKFTEQYQQGKLISGISTDSAGVKYNYTQRMIAPQYPGGAKALYDYLGKYIKYPFYEKEHNIQGLVMLGFTVKKDGSLTDVKVIKSAESALDNEALRVMKNSKGWEPGMYYGKPTNVYYSMPVAFALIEE